MLHPVEVSTLPMAQSKDHLSNIRCHVLQIVAAVARIHNDLTILLRHGHFVTIELSILFQELSFDMEFVLCVDCILTTLSILALSMVENIESTLTTSITILVNSVDGIRALVSCSMEGMSIGLLNIELRAPVASNLVGIAVLEWIVIVIDRRHEDGVEGRDAATAYFAQVNIVFEDATEQVWLVV